MLFWGHVSLKHCWQFPGEGSEGACTVMYVQLEFSRTVSDRYLGASSSLLISESSDSTVASGFGSDCFLSFLSEKVQFFI